MNALDQPVSVHSSVEVSVSVADATGDRRCTIGDIPIVCAHGSPQDLGEQVAARVGERIRSLLRLVRVRTVSARVLRRRRLARLIDGIGPRYYEELSVLAHRSGADLSELLAANVLVDSMCSALVSPATSSQPLRVARNMDFFPASIVGPRTVVMAMRPHQRHAVISFGWPGFAGVVSGMNDRGLTACVLINNPQRQVFRPGQPICFRIREILESCATVAEAEACFAAGPVASSHYVLLADATGSSLVWQGREGSRRDRPTQGWLAASNGRREQGLPCDRRGTILLQRAAALRLQVTGCSQMQSALQASYLPLLNAQAMVFTPQTRSIEFALGHAFRPAARSVWYHLDGEELLGDTARRA